MAAIITHLQYELSANLEAKDLASAMRVHSYYASNIGKIVPEPFQCTVEPKRG
jgi:hypothetical protein